MVVSLGQPRDTDAPWLVHNIRLYSTEWWELLIAPDPHRATTAPGQEYAFQAGSSRVRTRMTTGGRRHAPVLTLQRSIEMTSLPRATTAGETSKPILWAVARL